MIINHANLAIINQAFNATFHSGLATATPMWQQLATLVPSTAAEETYAWLGNFTRFREWIGERRYQSLMLHSYSIKNRTFENTVEVSRDDIDDDKYGLFSPVVQQLGQDAATHPDEMVFEVVNNAFSTRCYDGQYFFDTDHPVGTNGGSEVVSVSNTSGGAGTAWYLLDTSRAIRPLIFQKRRDYNLVSKTDETDDNVFMNKEYVYGVDARGNAGFGLWQLAFGSKQELNAANYEVARTAMQSFKGDEGRPLGVKPTVLIVPPSLEGKALDLINSTTLENGQSNKWFKSVEVIVTPWAA